MKVFNLACESGHRFEGWFASSDAFDDQLGRGLIHCPVCAATTVRRMPTAPRLNLSSSSEPRNESRDRHGETRDPQVPTRPTAMPTAVQLQAMWLKAARHLVRNTEDVGERFAEEARRIHYNETPERGIRGVTTADERAELEDEGIDVFSFPMPEAIEEPLQ